MRRALVILFALLCSVAYPQESYWRLENNGTDAQGNYNLTANGSATYTTTSADHIEGTYGATVASGGYFSTSGDYNFGPGGLTISFWIRNDNTAGFADVFNTGVNGVGNRIQGFVNLSTNTFYVRVHDGTNEATISSAIGAVNMTTGSMVTVRLMSTSGISGKIFVDGAQSGTDTTFISGWDVTAPLAVAGNFGGGSFYGMVDQFSIYTCALRGSEITGIYTNRTSNYTVPNACETAPPVAYVRKKLNKVLYFTQDYSFRAYDPPQEEEGGGSDLPSTYVNACYVDPISGNDIYDGSTPALAVASLLRASQLKNSYTVIALSDTAHYGTLLLDNWDGTSGTPKRVTTYNKYDRGNATVKGFKPVTGWSNVGTNRWSVVDGALPATRAFYLSRDRQIPYKYFLSWLLVGGVNYGNARTPNTGAYQNNSIASDGMSYMIDNDLSMSTNQYYLGYIYAMVEDWAGVKAQITSNTATQFNFYTADLNENSGGYDLNNENVGSVTHKYVIVNHTNCMDQHGEWVYKYDSTKLYLYSTTNPSSLSIMAPYVNKVIDIYQCSYLQIDHVNVWSGNVSGIQVENSNQVAIKNCEVYYGGYAGINVLDSWDTEIDSNIVGHSAGNGIAVQYTLTAGDHTITNNYVYDSGVKGYACDRDGYQHVGILSRYNDNADYINITYNYVENSGNNGISLSGSGTPDDEVCGSSFNIDYNFVDGYCIHAADGGGVYTGMQGSSTNSKSISHNVILNAGEDYTFRRDNRPFSMGIYNDNTSKYITTQYNTIFSVECALFVQYNSRNNLYRYNTIIDNNVASNYVLRTGGLYKETYNDGAGSPLTYSYNDVILTDNANSRGVNWTSDGTPYTYNTTMNYNDYYTPFRSDNVVIKSLESEPSFVMVDHTLASWTTKTGWEANSTLNKNSWRFSDVSGITQDQFVWVFINWSPTTHAFGLGSATFKDLDGNNVSGTVTVPVYSSKVLFYSSGSLSNVQNPIYAPHL